MGECNYYLVAMFDNGEVAREVAEILREYILPEMRKCYKCWQEIRNNTEIPARRRYGILKRKFDILKYLELDKLKCDNNDETMNFLSGKLSIGDDWSVKVLEVFGRYLVAVCSYDVWHFADWTHLAKLVKKLGAKKVCWTNEEEFISRLDDLFVFMIFAADLIKDPKIKNVIYEVDREYDEKLRNELRLKISLR